MKAIIIDDEPLAVQVIREYLEEFPEIVVIGEANNGYDGLKLIKDTAPDLAFLDIQMSKITGLELLDLLDKIPLIIFTTAYEEHARQAFDKDAVDYLLKPFSKKRFEKAIEKAKKRTPHEDTDYTTVFENLPNNNDCIERVVVKEAGKLFIVPVDDIYFIQAAEDYIVIVTENKEYIKHATMKFFEEKLPAKDFVRVHRSYIININWIQEIQPYSKAIHTIIMKNGRSLKTSKAGNTELKNSLQ
jgi:two-component system LytT family response regulator